MNKTMHTTFNPGWFLRSVLEPQQQPAVIPPNIALLENGILRYTPPQKSDNFVLLSAGIHGNETAPIELLDKLVTDITEQKITPLANLLIVFGNPNAIQNYTRFCDYNLNRLFFQDQSKNPAPHAEETTRATTIIKHTKAFFTNEDKGRYTHYDLHTTIRKSRIPQFALSPLLPKGRSLTQTQSNFLNKSGIPALLFSSKPLAGFSDFTSSIFDAESLTLELGNVAPLGENAMQTLETVDLALRDLLCETQTKTQTEKPNYVTYQIVKELQKETDAFSLHLSEDAENFTKISKGYTLYEDQGKKYITEEDVSIIFPNPHVANGERAGILVKPITT